MEQVAYGFRYSASGCQTLIEVPAKEAKAFFEAGPDARGRTFERCHASTAHQWVRNGFIHETALYIDENRVRRTKLED
jgi:hypothetical protein